MAGQDLEQQGVFLFAMMNGYFDNVAVDRVRECQARMGEFFTTRKADLLQKIADEKPDLKKDKATVDAIKSALEEFKSTWG